MPAVQRIPTVERDSCFPKKSLAYCLSPLTEQPERI
jgi:hypothetical protein